MKNKKQWIIALSVAAAFVVIYLITWAADLPSPPDDAASEVSNQTTVSDAATTAKQTEKENADTTASSPSKLQTTTTEQITTTTKQITTTSEAAETTQKAHPKIVFWDIPERKSISTRRVIQSRMTCSAARWTRQKQPDITAGVGFAQKAGRMSGFWRAATPMRKTKRLLR